MTEADPSPHQHAPRSDEADASRRTDIERAVAADPARGTNAGAGPTPLEPTGVPDGNAGTGGVTKNQDDMAQ